LSDGKVLGGKRIPLDEARRRARAAAEKRRDLTKGSGQKLGGGPIVPGQNIREVIVSAIERRKAVNQGCGMGHKDSKAIGDQATANGFKTQAEEDEANDRAIVQAYAELLQEEEKEREKWGDSYTPRESPAYNQRPKAETPSPASRKRPQTFTPRNGRPISRLVGGSTSGTITPSQSSQSGLSRGGKSAATAPIWTCPICTLENPLERLSCDACMSERPASTYRNNTYLSDGVVDNGKKATLDEGATKPARIAQWVCHRCGAYMDAQWWTCSLCGTMKRSS
jgi:DNA-dependent metalloprotease WSS1